MKKRQDRREESRLDQFLRSSGRGKPILAEGENGVFTESCFRSARRRLRAGEVIAVRSVAGSSRFATSMAT
jgi:hypothetical protein